MLTISEQLNLANHLPDIIIWSCFTALLSLFLDFCFRENNIFEGWLNYWADWWLSGNNTNILIQSREMTDEQATLLSSGKYDTVREYKFSFVKWFWFKPLGGCVVCFQVWLCFPFLFTQQNFIAFLAMILLSNFLVRFFKEKIL